MQVIKNSKEFTPDEIYELTLAPNGEKMTNHDGETLEGDMISVDVAIVLKKRENNEKVFWNLYLIHANFK